MLRVSNFFWATLIGLTPPLFLVVSIGSGLEKIIEQNLETPKITELLFSPDIYIPLGIFVILLVITFFFRKLLYR